ncbi:MAG: ACP phosphodiesterase [Spirosomaceae bacterium]|nr:ACP phosphodiesterase [Spirosomataceae bacterium]
MNYLAHFYLSFEQEPLIVGNLLGDFVRGRLDHPRNAHYTTPVKQGILLHRHIDSFTDTHPVGEACRRSLPAQFGKYKGVVMDMYFDYFLAKHFEEFHAQPLRDFAQNIYVILRKNYATLPSESHRLVDSMREYDWLYHYQFIEGMRRSFVGMSRRFAFLKGIDQAADELAANEALYGAYFRSFFPDLVGSCQAFLEE